jgi:hypothetical protein
MGNVPLELHTMYEKVNVELKMKEDSIKKYQENLNNTQYPIQKLQAKIEKIKEEVSQLSTYKESYINSLKYIPVEKQKVITDLFRVKKCKEEEELKFQTYLEKLPILKKAVLDAIYLLSVSSDSVHNANIKVVNATIEYKKYLKNVIDSINLEYQPHDFLKKTFEITFQSEKIILQESLEDIIKSVFKDTIKMMDGDMLYCQTEYDKQFPL